MSEISRKACPEKLPDERADRILERVASVTFISASAAPSNPRLCPLGLKSWPAKLMRPPGGPRSWHVQENIQGFCLMRPRKESTFHLTGIPTLVWDRNGKACCADLQVGKSPFETGSGSLL